MRHFLSVSGRGRLVSGLILGLAVAAITAGPAFAADADGDGMPNRWERTHGLNPHVANAAGNPDRDGLANIGEYRRHGHPKREDTDGDGVDDGDEAKVFGSNLADRDSDDDGRIDGHEDADHDGIKNEDEDDPLEGCLADDDDSDHDGVANEDENELGTRARDGDSDDDGIEDGTEDRDEDGEANEDEDDSDTDACDGDYDEDGEADEDEEDVLGSIISFDSTSGLLTIQTRAGYLFSATLAAETELEWEDGGCGEVATTADLVPDAEVAEVDLDDDTGALDEVELVCPLPEPGGEH